MALGFARGSGRNSFIKDRKLTMMSPDKILFFWQRVTSPLSETRLNCIKRWHEIYPESQHVIISNEEIWPEWMERIGLSFIKQRISDKYGANIADSFMPLSDYARLEWLSENDYCLYADTDTYPLGRLDLDVRMACSRGLSCVWSGDQRLQIAKCFKEFFPGRQILFNFSERLFVEGALDLTEQILHKEKTISAFLCGKEKNKS